jgi:ADP-ribose pyrophosphatase YjhB (NUDIX family)
MKTVYKVRALVTDHKGRVYAIRAKAPHVLQLPGGSRYATESLRRALKREMREELGCKVRIISEVMTLKIKRNGTREITTFYLCRITARCGEPTLTKRERQRGLSVCRYKDLDSFRAALSERIRTYGRSACKRDYRLATAAARAM